MNPTEVRSKVQKLLDYEAINDMFCMTSRERAEFQQTVMDAMDIDRPQKTSKLLNMVMQRIVDNCLRDGMHPVDVAVGLSKDFDMPIKDIMELSGVYFVVE